MKNHKNEDMEFHTKAYKQLVWLYDYLCKQLNEDKKNLTLKSELEKEVNALLIKNNCIPLY